MRRSFLLLVLALWTAFPAISDAAVEPFAVTLKPQVVVEGPVVHLGDLFAGLENRGELASTPVAEAPAAGMTLELSARWLGAVARAYGLGWQPRSQLDRTILERASQTLSVEPIRAALFDALQARGAGGNVELTLDNPEFRVVLPIERPATFALQGLVYDAGSGRFFAQVVAPAEGPIEARIKVSGTALPMTEVPVLRRRMTPGQVIRESDIEWLPTRADRLAKNSLTEIEDILDLSPRRPIMPGQVIRAGDLTVPVVVAKNGLVTIRLVAANMELTAQGRALQDGSLDEAIRVMNTKSNQVVTAVVRSPDSVEVIAPGLAAAN